MKAIVLCEGSYADRLICGDGAPPASDIGEVVRRNPKVGTSHRDIDLRQGLSSEMSIFSHVMSKDFAGSTFAWHRHRETASDIVSS